MSSPWFAWVPMGERPEPAVGGGEVADRREAALAERQLEREAADPRDRLQLGRAGRQQPRRARRCGDARSRMVAAAEGGNGEGPDRDDRDRDDNGEPPPADLVTMRSAEQRALGPWGGIRRTVPEPVGAINRRADSPTSAGRFVPEHCRVEREPPVFGQRPVPGRRAARSPAGRGGTIGPVSAPAGPPPRIQIPRWIQLVGLPLVVLGAWIFASAAGHTLFLFLIAALIALLLDPIVLTLGAFKVRRGLAVAIVYLTFAAALVLDHRGDRDRRRWSDQDGG